ncbi:hypothetical protein [Aliamphritea spongicola]|uniref:hypothetical protein n=1 Tax=Aliamphritea spongicola TaxID=707589 RepID=UPI00196B1818|nr:hypothetical protein [Aliamphritea spongicola]MBN3563292.1 hypothetical protein [Aliamphritea spongicola]
MKKFLAVKRTYVLLNVFWLACFAALPAAGASYQPSVPGVKNTDRARAVLPDKNAQQGFSYRFQEKIEYTDQFNVYIVGQHCYRGGPVRFSVPEEHFVISIGDQEYEVFGRSVWDRFYTDSRWNFILSKLQLGYWVVELQGDACADVVLDTRYKTAELLKQARGSDVAVKVLNKADDMIGAFVLQIR